VPACTSAVAIASKYIARTRSANVFNPAALGLVATFYVFNTGQSWWGALPEISPLALMVLFATGVFISDRVNKIPVMCVVMVALVSHAVFEWVGAAYYLCGRMVASLRGQASARK
jgi:Na+-transporting NADH:ubiquinone oxidoreductase subunit NqrB